MKISIRDLAREAGVHHTTVSRALRNDLGVSVAVRDRIKKLAAIRGYTPDPILSALIYHRKQSTRPSFQATLGWITAHPTRDGWRKSEKVGHYQGACARARELGYQIEEFWFREPGMTERRATQILLARNIRGLFFVPQPRSRGHINLDWSLFSAIAFNHTLARPILNTVTTHHFRSMRLIMRKLKKLGYRRIGLACWPEIQEAVDRNWTAAYWAYQPQPYHMPIPVFCERKWKRDPFFRWLDRHRPEVVVSHDLEILSWLKERGLRIPKDIGFVNPAITEGPKGLSGVAENNQQIGIAAVNLIVDMIHRGERGIPITPSCHLIEGTWIQGSMVHALHG